MAAANSDNLFPESVSKSILTMPGRRTLVSSGHQHRPASFWIGGVQKLSSESILTGQHPLFMPKSKPADEGLAHLQPTPLSLPALYCLSHLTPKEGDTAPGH